MNEMQIAHKSVRLVSLIEAYHQGASHKVWLELKKEQEELAALLIESEYVITPVAPEVHEHIDGLYADEYDEEDDYDEEDYYDDDEGCDCDDCIILGG